ncbi:hypothetical protein ACV229_15430 [Burkholderia sp. MR1-5-21]
MATTLQRFSELLGGIPQSEERKLHVAAILYGTIAQNVTSFQLFMAGHTVAAALYRQVLESIALTFLCSAKTASASQYRLTNLERLRQKFVRCVVDMLQLLCRALPPAEPPV